MIIAIDPGSLHSAFVKWHNNQIIKAEIVDNNLMLALLRNSKSIESDYIKPMYLIEMVASYGMPVGKTVFDTVVWIGRFVEALDYSEQSWDLVYRQQIKLHHCGQVRAKDSNIIQALKDKYGEKGTKKNPGLTYPLKADAWQAFAIATYWSETHSG